MSTQYPDALLEHWMREAYFTAQFDIGSSGVENYQLRELRRLIGLELEELDQIVFHDSQTLGGDALRKVIADRYANGQSERVMVTHGSTEANYLIHLALINPGDNVVILDPVYQQLGSLAEALGARTKRWKLDQDDDFRPRLENLKSVLTSSTKLVIVNFPHNPTGTTLTPEQYDEFLSMIRSVGAWLLWDAAFAELVYDGKPLPDPTSTYDRAISIGTLSKSFGLPGLRVGWCIAPQAVLDKCARLRDYVSLHLSPMVELLAERVIRHSDAVIANGIKRAKENLAVCNAWAKEHQNKIAWYPPQGGVCAFPHLRNVDDVDDLCRKLLTKRVLTVPGSCFGQPRHIRLGFGGNRAGLEAGLHQLSQALDSA